MSFQNSGKNLCDNLSKVNITFFIKIGTKQKSTYLRCNFLDDYIRKKKYVRFQKYFKKWCPTVWRSIMPSRPLNGPPRGGRPVVWIGGLGPPLGWPPIMWWPNPASLPPGNWAIIGWSLRPGGPLANGGPPLVWWSRAGPMLWWWPSKIWLLLEAEMFSLSSLVPEPFLFKSAPSFEGDPCRLPIVRLCGKKCDYLKKNKK